jgi:hypothetical protein
MYRELREANLEPDLVYAPITWISFFANLKKFTGCIGVYVHTGGQEGNASMWDRYRYMKLIKP